MSGAHGVQVKFAFGENVLAIMERAGTDLSREDLSVTEACRRVLSGLTGDELGALKNYYPYTETVAAALRKSSPPLLAEEHKQSLMRETYLCDGLKGFLDSLDGWSHLALMADEKGLVQGDLPKSTAESIDALRRAARLYEEFWADERKNELNEIALRLQDEVRGFPNVLERVENTLRGETGLTHVEYYIVDNKYPNCSARKWGGEAWVVGWSHPDEVVNASTALGIVADEVAHWVMSEPFTEEKRETLVQRLSEDLYKRRSLRFTDVELLEAVRGIEQVLMEGFGHVFIGFPWLEDEAHQNTCEPRRRGKPGTLYYESYHFTKWFHERWEEFRDSGMAARDWGWQCLEENRELVADIAQVYLERGTIY